MKVSIVGAGAIGSLVAGYLTDKGIDVTLIGRDEDVIAIRNKGLSIEGVRGSINIPVKATRRLDTNNDIVVIAVKTQDITQILNAEYTQAIGNALVIGVQNGVRADEILTKVIPKGNIASSIVMFGSTYIDRGWVLHNFEGDWILGKTLGNNNGAVDTAAKYLGCAFKVHTSDRIIGMKWLKLFLNLNNSLPALTGKSMQETFNDIEIARLSIGLLREATALVDRANIELVSLPDFPVERLRSLVNLPSNKAAEIFSQTMTRLSKEPLDGSILQSIKRGKRSEIDYFNGEIVCLGEKMGMDTPLNRSMVNLVHEVETSGRFFGKDEILNKIGRQI